MFKEKAVKEVEGEDDVEGEVKEKVLERKATLALRDLIVFYLQKERFCKAKEIGKMLEKLLGLEESTQTELESYLQRQQYYGSPLIPSPFQR